MRLISRSLALLTLSTFGGLAIAAEPVDAGAADADLALDEATEEIKRLIKVVPPKTFLKLGRFEAVPNVGFVTNDPFLNRYMIGVGLGYHLTEIFAIEGNLAYSPDLGRGDWKPITEQLVDKNHVSPDISKLQLVANGTFLFSPIYGKVALNGNRIINFDIYGAFGMGVTQTVDDLVALQAENDPIAEATRFAPAEKPCTTLSTPGGRPASMNAAAAPASSSTRRSACVWMAGPSSTLRR